MSDGYVPRSQKKKALEDVKESIKDAKDRAMKAKSAAEHKRYMDDVTGAQAMRGTILKWKTK